MNEIIDYSLVRSDRKTADIIIERDGSLVVRAPSDLATDEVEAIVESKKLWIYTNLAKWRDLNATQVIREYCIGEGFLYLGRSHKLRFEGDQEADLMLKNGYFCMKRSLVDQGDEDLLRKAFRDFYIRRGKAKIQDRVDYFASKVGVKTGDIEVRELGHRWGLCSPEGDLAFHWKCLMAPASVIDYIIVHELCHIHHLDHSKEYWNEVDKVMPDYRERLEWLRNNGASLDL
ncbi:MAG: putative metal-dependent hydrolase [Rubritalea sp.]|jgi:predicted metal-dependent hydrolase